MDTSHPGQMKVFWVIPSRTFSSYPMVGQTLEQVLIYITKNKKHQMLDVFLSIT